MQGGADIRRLGRLSDPQYLLFLEPHIWIVGRDDRYSALRQQEEPLGNITTGRITLRRNK